MTHILSLLWLPALVACTDKADDTGRPGRPTDGGSPTDGGGSDGGDGGDGGTTGTSTVRGIELLERNTEELASIGVEILTYGITEKHEPYYTNNEGEQAYFYLLRVADWDYSTGPVRGILWLHGGGAKSDAEEIPVDCTLELNDLLAYEGMVGGRQVIAQTIAAEGGVVILPVATWCDIWGGLGEDDPVDSNHKSLVHVKAIMDAVVSGLDGVTVDAERVGVWGSSLGGSGTFPVANHLVENGITPVGLVTDSGPVHIADLYGDSFDISVDFFEHVFGGAPYSNAKPTEWFDNYLRMDGVLMIEQAGFRLPVMSTFNSYDVLTDIFHGDDLEAALETWYGPEGARYFSMDYNHHSPGDLFHTQSAVAGFPACWSTQAAIDFLDGYEIRYFEAEGLCPRDVCQIWSGVDDEEAPDEVLRSVNETAVVRYPDDGAGVILSATIPGSVPRDQDIELLIAIDTLEVTGDSDSTLVTITLRDTDTDTDAVVVDVPWEHLRTDQVGSAARLNRIDATTLQIPAGLLDTLTSPRVEVVANDAAMYFVDGLWVRWRDAE